MRRTSIATLYNFDEEMTASVTAMQPSDMFLVHQASSSVKKSITGTQIAAEKYTAGGASATLSAAVHGGKTILLDTAAGTTITLPQATGTGTRYKFLVSVLATAASHIVKVGNSTDIMVGLAFGARTDSGNAVLGFATSATSDTITLNRTTTGSVNIGEWIEVHDEATGQFAVRVFGTATGAAYATPFSATV